MRTLNPVKVGLVQINNSYLNSFYFPYSVGLLQAYFQQYAKHTEDFEFLNPIFSRMPVAETVKQLEEAEIVAFSVYAWNFRVSLEIAKRLKRKNSDATILFGGPNVPNKSQAFLKEHPFINIACHGEGEIVFKGILENYHARDWGNVPSITYSNNGAYIQTPEIPRIKDISSVPSPYLQGIFDNLMNHNPGCQWMALWETNRGCPYKCAYCDWGAYTKSKVYPFDTERLKDEIGWFAKNKIEFIYCCDANFGILERDLNLVRYIADYKGTCGYPKSLSVHDAKNSGERTYAIQSVLYGAGLSKGVSLALQTLDETTLKNVGRLNSSIGLFKELQRKFNSTGIETYTEFIQGLPGETYGSFTKGISGAIENGQHNRIRIGSLVILPNAQMADPEYQKEYGFQIIETKCVNQHSSLDNPEIEETQAVVVATKAMPRQDWVKGKVFFYWCSLLYCSKILQIPILLLHEVSGYGYKELFELFFIEDTRYPIISDIQRFFRTQARNAQHGKEEFCKSTEWLNLYWPPDEYMFIKLIFENRLKEFYAEAKSIFSENLGSQSDALPEAITLNESLIKKPFQREDIILRTEYNIWEWYLAALGAKRIALKKGAYTYRIDCSSEAWNTWDEWFRNVVWYSSKQGAYLYRIK